VNIRYSHILVAVIVTLSYTAMGRASQGMATGNASRCNVAVLTAPRITITSADSGNSGENTSRCVINGELRTQGEDAPPGLAHFRIDLPFQWNGKLVFNGGGGFNGYIEPPPLSVLAQGYATLSTDSGHIGGPPTASVVAKLMNYSWMTKPAGGRNDAAVADYLYRSIHQVREAVSPLVAKFYGASIRRAYFWGCSNGGREAMFNAMQNPQDFDGFIAGDPSIVPALGLPEIWKVKVLRDGQMPYSTLQRVDAAVMQACDSVDGVKDGLIQNPAACRFDFGTLVKKGILTSRQAEALTLYTSAIHDDTGALIEPGGTVSAMSGSGHDEYTNGLPGYMVDSATEGGPGSAAAFKNLLQYRAAIGLIGGIGFGDLSLDLFGPRIFDPNGVIRHEAVIQLQRAWVRGIGDPTKMQAFLRLNRKLIIYQGLADHDTTPYESQLYYEALARASGGLARIKRNARLFLAPGMEHCEGGPGPNSFDPLESLDNWVEHDSPPEKIIARKFVDDDPKRSLQRSMPLCPFPGIAHYDGHGNVNDAASWACVDTDTTLTRYGPVGKRAGLGDTWGNSP
jgi:feruloyl esterase